MDTVAAWYDAHHNKQRAPFPAGSHAEPSGAHDAYADLVDESGLPLSFLVIACWDTTGVNDGAVLGDQCAAGHSLAPLSPDAAGTSLASHHQGPASIYPLGLTDDPLALAAVGCLVPAHFDEPAWPTASPPGDPFATGTDLTPSPVSEARLGQLGQPPDSTTTTPPKCPFDLGSRGKRVFVQTAVGGKRRHPSNTESSPSSDATCTASTSSSPRREPKSKKNKKHRRHH